MGKNRGFRIASYKSIINVEWFHKHDLNKSTTFYSDFSVYKLFSGSVGNSSVSLSYNYTTFDYLVFSTNAIGKANVNDGWISNIRIINQAEFAAIIAVSKFIGGIVGLARDSSVSGGINVSFALAINATKSFTGTYWSAGFLQAMHRDNYNTYNNPAKIYGIKRK